MLANEIQILRRLAFLVACHDLAVGHIVPKYTLLERPMSWFKARRFCQRHYVDLAVPSSEDEYYTLLDASAAKTASFWLGLHRQSSTQDWKWVSGEELGYDRWYRWNYVGRCASLEAMLENNRTMLARYCAEWHMFVCQGPVSPQTVAVASAGSDHLTLRWNVSAFMQMTPHTYNVTMCSDTCDTLFFAYTGGAAVMNVSLRRSSPHTEYFIEISSSVVRIDSWTGRNTTLRSSPIVLQVRTADSDGQYTVIIIIWKSLKPFYMAVGMWILYSIVKKYELKEPEDDVAPVEPSSEETVVQLIDPDAHC